MVSPGKRVRSDDLLRLGRDLVAPPQHLALTPRRGDPLGRGRAADEITVCWSRGPRKGR